VASQESSYRFVAINGLAFGVPPIIASASSFAR
jgi:hypothetical protein